MLPGISTACFYPLETETALELLTEHGVLTTEIFINTTSELEPGYLRRLRGIAETGGTKIVSVHPFSSGMEPILFFSAYERRFQDGRELYRRYYEAAAALGAEFVVFHGAHPEPSIEPERLMERLGMLMEDAAGEGVRLCHENVSRTISRNPAFFQKLTAAFPEAGFVFDLKQAVRAGEDVIGFAQAMGGGMVHIHLSDHDRENDCLPPGKGSFDLGGFLGYARSLSYTGSVIVELYRGNYTDYTELFSSYQYLAALIKAAEREGKRDSIFS